MSPEISEALCSLCRAHGWSYGVCWRFDCRDPRLLVMGDSYYEESIGTTISKMITQLHFAGEGTIGVAAVTGKHQWINSDTSLEGIVEWQHKFSAGMKTIAIISLPSFGVVQFGSMERICESLEFINQVQRSFCLLGDMKEHSLPGNAYNTTDIWDPFEDFGSVHSSMRTSASQNNTSSFHDAITKELQDNAAPSTSHMPSSTSNCRPSAIPIISSPTALSLSVNNPFLRIPSSNSISSLRVTSQCLGSGAEAEALLLPKNSMPSGYSSPSNSFAANLNANFWAATSSFSGYRGNSASTHGIGGSQVVISGSVQMVTSSLSPPAKSSSKSSSVASELPDSFLSFPQDSAPEHSAFFQFKDDQTKDQIVPCEQPSVQVTNSQALSTEDNITTVQSEAIIPSKPVEICATTATDSVNAGYDWKGSSSNRPNQLLADNDLFEGMELDLSPGILRQESWDDIIMPVGSSSCSNLSTNISECMPDMGMGSLAAADKGLFYGSSFEQLLDAVVEESANPLSGNSSVPVGVSSTGSLDFSQVSTVNRVDSHKGNMKLAPLAEFNLEKIFQQSSNEALVQSRVSSWTDGAGIRNAESVVTNKAKKPEETSKVKKRARPGESTRPRPKDRQQIQDRVKELREIVPNGAKCSIDSLLDRTIKHMLFLQSVTKYVDKLKQTDEPKMIGDESGVVLKDNSGGGGAGGGGATWAYEVAGQTMVCPILVEDLNPPGQMLVEMLCEERGFFLEIADIIRGFGLTILKGEMEIRETKIWARFLVEANREVTRMDIFLSLVQLLQQTSSIRTNEQQIMRAPDKGVCNTFSQYQQPHVPIPISMAARLQ